MVTEQEARPARYKHKWTPEELHYLSDHYGLLLDGTIACNLGRSVCGISWAARKLKLRRKDNLYTATELARVLGIAGSETVIGWVQRGWLKCRRGPLKAGLNRAWVFTEGTVAKFLRQRPWVVDLASMTEHYFRSVVEREWERDPWYTCQQAAPLLGVKADTTVQDYCSRGWLSADKNPQRGGRSWVIRHSAIQEFLANDPRPQSNHYTISEARRRFLIEAGQASMLTITWIIRCPRCRQQVRIMAPPQLRGAEVRERFIRLHVNGNCEHSSYCLIPTETPKPGPLSRATRARRAASAGCSLESSNRGRGHIQRLTHSNCEHSSKCLISLNGDQQKLEHLAQRRQ